MSLTDKLKEEGKKLALDPRVLKLAQDPRFFKLVMAAMSVPGRVTSFTQEQRETFAKAMGLATSEEVRDLRRIVTSLEEEVARLRSRL